MEDYQVNETNSPVDSNAGRVPPQNIDAEQSVLGAMLLDNDCISVVTSHITASDFYRKDHAYIFEAIVELYNDSITADIVTLAEKLAANGNLEKAGGIVYLSDLTDSVPLTANAEMYAKIIEEKSLLRKLIRSANGIIDKAYDARDEAVEVMDYAEQSIFEIMSGKDRSDLAPGSAVISDLVSHLEELFKNKGKLSGIPTGFKSLDQEFSGLQKSDFILIAARPAMGKTALALNIAQNASLQSRTPVAIFSLEMSRQQLMSRMVSSQALIEGTKMRDGSLDDEDWKKVTHSVSVFSDMDQAPIYIDDTAGITVTEIRSKCRKLKLEHGLGLVVIDYLQLMESPSGSKNDNRQAQVSAITRSLKVLAKELDVPVVSLAQLSRKAEEHRRPMLQDLRESGSIEQDADIVMFIYRDDYYNKDSDDKGVAEIIIAKNRHGNVGTKKLAWLPQYTKFVDLDPNRE